MFDKKATLARHRHDGFTTRLERGIGDALATIAQDGVPKADKSLFASCCK